MPTTTLPVTVAGAPGDGIDVTIRNPLGFADSTAHGAGLGLVGLVERAELRGGTLVHGRERSAFVVRGSIPWPT